jgi:hypothetical protein
MLAVTVALDDPSQVGSFLAVGSKVAVFDTFNVQSAAAAGSGTGSSAAAGATTGSATTGSAATGPTPAGDRLQDRHEYSRATRLLLTSVEVLAVGATTTIVAPPPTDAQSSAAIGTAGGGQTTTTLFTLAVTQERIIHSSRTGALTFALLGPQAHATTGKGVDDRTLFEVTS